MLNYACQIVTLGRVFVSFSVWPSIPIIYSLKVLTVNLFAVLFSILLLTLGEGEGQGE